MEQFIQTAEELYDYFFRLSRSNTNFPRGHQHALEALVTGKIRKDVLCSVEQGKIILDGRVKRISFENLGGGVYKATVEQLGS